MKLIESVFWIVMGLVTIIWSGYMLGSELSLFDLPQEILLFFPLIPIGLGIKIVHMGIIENKEIVEVKK